MLLPMPTIPKLVSHYANTGACGTHDGVSVLLMLLLMSVLLMLCS